MDEHMQMETPIEYSIDPAKQVVSARMGVFGLAALAVGMALVVRLAGLGLVPLSETEAAYAYQAYQVSQGDSLQLLSHPAYIFLTGILFYFFPSGDALARFVPALVGGLAVLAPFTLRKQLGERVALVAAFGLAIDPLLTAYSRQAGSPVMAIGFATLTVLLWQSDKKVLAGFFGGLMLLSGPSAVFGLIVLGIAGVGALAGRMETLAFIRDRDTMRPFLFGMLLALGIVGTMFLRYPQGLSAMLQAVPDAFAGWTTGGIGASAPILQVNTALFIYQPLAVLFAGIAIFKRGFLRSERAVFLLYWLLLVVLLSAILPGRQVSDLVWALPPLWLLAATRIAPHFSSPDQDNRLVAAGLAVFLFVLALYWGNSVSRLAGSNLYLSQMNLWVAFQSGGTARVYIVRLLVAVILPLVMLGIMYIVASGWSREAAFQGASWGISAYLVLYLVANVWGFTDNPEQVANELWISDGMGGYTQEIAQAVEDASLQITGTQDDVEMAYLGGSSVLDWLFREQPNAHAQSVIDVNTITPVLITPDEGFAATETGQLYRGQRLPLQVRRTWDGTVYPADFFGWLAFRNGPVETEWVYVWTRADLFPLYQPETELDENMP